MGANDTNADKEENSPIVYVGWRIAINGCEREKIKNGGDGEVDSPKSESGGKPCDR